MVGKNAGFEEIRLGERALSIGVASVDLKMDEFHSMLKMIASL